MLAAQDAASRCKELGITALHVRIRATGGNEFVFELTRQWTDLQQETVQKHQDLAHSRRYVPLPVQG